MSNIIEILYDYIKIIIIFIAIYCYAFLFVILFNTTFVKKNFKQKNNCKKAEKRVYLIIERSVEK